MSKMVRVVWRVEDGYAGPDRPHSSNFSAASFDTDATDEELADEICEAVRHDFEQTISLSLKTEDVMAAVKAVRAATSDTRG